MERSNVIPRLLGRLRREQGLTQEQLAKHLGVSFATVNRWESGKARPRPAMLRQIEGLAITSDSQDRGSPREDALAAKVPARRGRRGRLGTDGAGPTTKPMEQMLWDAACSIRGEKDAPKFKDFLLPLLFLKRLSDVFDDEIARLAEDYGDANTALEIGEGGPSLLCFY